MFNSMMFKKMPRLLPLIVSLWMPFAFVAQAVPASANSPDTSKTRIVFDFEQFEQGPLHGQYGWTADSATSVTAEDAHSGSQSVRIADLDPSKAFGPIYNFTPISKGKIEWWAKTDSQVRLITQIQKYSPDGTKTIEWIGFYSPGTFVYYDGPTRKLSDVSYQPNTWYRFTVLFDSDTQTKTIIISDEEGPIFYKSGIGYWDAADAVNRIRFSTISTDTGVFHVDDILIREGVQDDAADLRGIQLVRDEFSLMEGDTAELQVIGNYGQEGLNELKENNLYESNRPDVASVDGNGRITALKSGEAIITVTNSVYEATARVNVFGPEEIPPYVDIDPRPIKRETALDTLKIMTPESADWKQAGEQIANLLESKWGIDVSVEVSREDEVGDGWSGNVLVLGNLGNNPHIARLYGLYLSYSDAVHPGDGGYQLQTIVDPFGKGGNTILLGASDLDGLAKGVQRLGAIVDGLSAPELPWLSESVISEEAASHLPYGKDPTESDVQKELANADAMLAQLNPNSTDELEADHLLSLLGRMTYMGKLYQLTNNENYGQLYKYYLKGYAAFLNRYPATAQAQLLSTRNMWRDGYANIGSWTVMEASPLFSEQDRRQIVSAFYLTYDANSRDSYLVKAPETGARYNHDVFPALSIIFGASYFTKYHQLPIALEWHRLGDRIFKGNTSNINYDEGSDYLMHVPSVTLEYAMATGDRRFLALGLRPSADLNAMMIDNLGTMSGGGDVYPFGRSSAYTWNHSQVMNAASWFFKEPLYQFLLNRTRTGPFEGQDMSDLSFPFHRYMTDVAKSVTELTGDYPMVQAYPVERGVYDELIKDTGGSLDVPIEETFHKLAFREGYDLDDSYLMVDGFSAGRHGHMDGNTIIKYSAKGRIFIDDRDYIEKAPKNHTGLVVIKDGVQEEKPPLARLVWASEAEDIGISRSVMPNYNGVDWTRTIVSPGGRFFLIYDDVQVNEEGRYIFENTWQTLGNLTIRGDRFDVEQQGITMTIQSLDDSDLREYERYGHFVKYWKTIYPYPYADEEHVLREVKEERAYPAGDTYSFINVLSSKDRNVPDVRARRLNENVIRIEEGSDRWYASWGPLSANGFHSDGKFHLVGEKEVLIAEVKQLNIGGQTLSFDQPVLLKLKPEEGTWSAYRLDQGLTRYDENGNPIRDGTVEKGTIAIDRNLIHSLRQELQHQENPTPWKKPQPQHPESNREWQKEMKFGEEITSSALGDVNGDGTDELVLGGKNGKIQVIGSDGQTLWTFQSRGRVNEVSVNEIAGEPVVLVGTENWFVHVLNADGTERWHKEIPNSPERREMKGNLIGVTNVRVAYVNGGDQEPWIMVGTQFRYLYGFDVNGNLQYEDIAYYYGIEDTAFLDLDGDGKDEGMLGLEYYYYSILDEGKLSRHGGTKYPGPGFKVVEPLEQWSGGNQPAVLLGTKQNRVHLIRYNGTPQELWARNVGGEVNDIRAGDFDGDGVTEIIVASDGFQLYCLETDGSVRWRITLDDRVMRVGALQTTEGVRYYAVTDNGGLYTLDRQGEILSSARFADRIQGIHPGPAAVWVTLENGDVYRNRR